MQMTHHPRGRKQSGTEEPLDEGEKGVKNLAYNSTLKDHGIQSHRLMQIEGEAMETVIDFISLDSEITRTGTAAMKLKDACSLKEQL